jgi:hypothetical protein
MDDPLVVETDLLGEDWATIGQALTSAGRRAYEDVSWLLALGLDRFAADEAEWNRLEAESVPEADPRRQELKRREIEALATSMRARTIAAEMQMHELADRVDALGDELEAHRRTMRALRDENAALEERLRRASQGRDDEVRPIDKRHAPLEWLLGFLGGRGGE